MSPPCRLSGQLLEAVEQVGSRDSPDNHNVTYSVLPELSDSYRPYRSAAIFSPEDLEVCSSLEVASEYSIVKVIKLQLDTHIDLLFFVPQTSAVPREVIPVGRPCRDILI